MKFRFRKWMLVPAGLVLLVFLAPLLAVVVLVQRARQEQRAVAAIESLGGDVYYHHQYSDHLYDEAAEPPGPPWLRLLLGESCLARVHTVWLQHWDVPAWKHRPVEDQDLGHLADLSNLQRLMLDHSNVTDAGLRQLQGHPLTELHLVETNVTNEGVRNLTRLETLVSLNLGKTKIDEGALDEFRKMPRLQWVHVGGTRISKDAIQRFNRDRGSEVLRDGSGPFVPPP